MGVSVHPFAVCNVYDFTAASPMRHAFTSVTFYYYFVASNAIFFMLFRVYSFSLPLPAELALL